MRSQANFRLSECQPSSSHALQSREPLGPVPPDIGPRAAEARRGIPRRGQDRRVPVPRVDLPCLFQGGERLGGRFPARRRTPCAAWPRASWNAPRAGAPTAAASRRSRAPGWRDGRSGLAVTRAPPASPAPSGPSSRRCSVQPSRGRGARHLRAPRLLWAWPPDALEPCRARRGTHLGWGCQCSVITARYCPASLSS